jgi:mannitol/fructose-specific phosphotransferase system IIA component (Ntr-type)
VEPFVSLFLLSQPIDFDAVDGRPVHALFMIVATSIPEHLRTLASLGFVLRDGHLRKLLCDRADNSEILGRIRALEAGNRPESSSAK